MLYHIINNHNMIYIFFVLFYTIISMYNTTILFYKVDNLLQGRNNVTIVTNMTNENNETNETNETNQINLNCDFYSYYNFSHDPELFIPIILVPNLSHTNIQNLLLE